MGLAAKSKKAQISAGIRQVAALLGQSEGALHDGLRYEHDARSGRGIQEKFADSSGGEAWTNDKQSGAFSNIVNPTGADEHNVHGNEQRRRRDASSSAAKENVNDREKCITSSAYHLEITTDRLNTKITFESPAAGTQEDLQVVIKRKEGEQTFNFNASPIKKLKRKGRQ